MMRSAGLLLAMMATLAGSAGCTTQPMCVPDGSPACECAQFDTRECTADGGVPGIQACSMSGFWTACAPFMDAGPEDHQVYSDTGNNLPDFGPRREL
jgi:hypothetical protein